MPTAKTFLTPEEQWKRTIQYVRRGWSETNLRMLLWVVRTRHRLWCVGDVFVVTVGNGMVERYGMSGISSKGVKLRDYYISLHSFPDDVAQLPGDLIALQWDDPAIGRFVADLRASSRRRVGASIPASIQRPLSGIRTQGLRFDGYYGAGRVPRPEQARHRRQIYLRFFPDGRVITGHFSYVSPINPERFKEGAWGKFTTYSLGEGGALSFSYVHDGEVWSRYEGHILDGRIRLKVSRFFRPGLVPREHVFRFFQWVE
jgi:hypothetical protein